MTEVFVTINDETGRYYLLKVVRHGFDIYCIPPHLGAHYSVHRSGKGHVRFEEDATKSWDEPAVVLIAGEAGVPIGNGIMRIPLADLGRASGICSAIYPIASLSSDFRKFNRSPRECFMIEKGLFQRGTSLVEIGVWAVPSRNQISFDLQFPDISAELLYKVVQCEPQIWIFARPFI